MKVRVQYIGRRLSEGKLYHVFLAGKEEKWWSKARGVWIGQWYEAEKKDKHYRLAVMPKELKNIAIDKEKVVEWRALDMAAWSEYSENKVRKKFENIPLSDDAKYELKRFLDGKFLKQKRQILELLLERIFDESGS